MQTVVWSATHEVAIALLFGIRPTALSVAGFVPARLTADRSRPRPLWSR